jgi:hypothetical protein
MTHRLIIPSRWDDDSAGVAIFQNREIDFIEITDQFEYTAVYMLIQILNWSLEERYRDLQMMRFDGDTFPSDDRTGMTKDEWIHAVSSDRDVEFGDAIIANLSFLDWCVWFGVLLNSIEDLSVTIFMERAMFNSLSGFVQTVHKGPPDMKSWTSRNRSHNMHASIIEILVHFSGPKTQKSIQSDSS